MLSKLLFNSLLHLLLAYRYIYICNRFQSQCAESFRIWLIALERWKLYPAVLCLLSSLTYWQQTEKERERDRASVCAGGLAASVAVVSNKFIIQFECSRQHLPYFSPTPFTCGYLSCQLATQCLQQLVSSAREWQQVWMLQGGRTLRTIGNGATLAAKERTPRSHPLLC